MRPSTKLPLQCDIHVVALPCSDDTGIGMRLGGFSCITYVSCSKELGDHIVSPRDKLVYRIMLCFDTSARKNTTASN